jgi:hypothetical protein
MRRFGRRLDKLEERKAFEEFLESKAEFDGRSEDELDFFALHGNWPENATILPPKRECVMNGIRTIVITEWADKR